MQKRIIKIALGLMLVLSITSVQAAGNSLTLVADTWPPYVDRNMPEYGMAAEIVTTALKRSGYSPKVQIENWMRVLEGGELGFFDGIVAAWKTPAREEKFVFSNPYYRNRVVLVKKKGADFKFNEVMTSQGLVAGYVEGYAYNEKIRRPGNIILVPSNHVLQNLLKLQNGQIDLTLGDEGVIKHLLAEYFSHTADEFEMDEKAFSERNLYLMVSKLNPAHAKIIEAFNTELVKMKKDGTYDAIISRHMK
jgi:polar amino acid transport system substrate-binding protein